MKTVPRYGWFIQRIKNEIKIYFNGEQISNISSYKVGADANTMLDTLELKLIGMDIEYDL